MFLRAAVVVLLIGYLAGLAMAAAAAQQPEALDARDPIPYFIANGDERTGYRASDRQLAEWALQAWQRAVPGALRFVAAGEAHALVRLNWAGPADGQYGEMRPIMVGGRRGAAVYIRPDMDALGQHIARRAGSDDLLRESIVYLTCLHELGHALGLRHTSDFRDIMYFFGYGGDIALYFGRYRAGLRSRNDIATVSGLSEADVERIRALYRTP